MKYQPKHIILLITLLLIQIIWFNHILLLNRFQPIIYIFPLLLLPVYQNESTNLLIAFFTGLVMDFFLHTGGVFAATTVFIVYLRKIYFSFTKTPALNIDKFDILNLDFGNKILFYSIFIFLTYFFIFWFESLRISIVLLKIPLLLVNTLISILFIIFIEYFFIQNRSDQ